jgi:hypothetical protein
MTTQEEIKRLLKDYDDKVAMFNQMNKDAKYFKKYIVRPAFDLLARKLREAQEERNKRFIHNFTGAFAD